MRTRVMALLSVVLAAGTVVAQAPRPTFRLFFLGHEVGSETDSGSAGHHRYAFHFDDRGTAVDLTASLDLAPDGSPHFLIKGRNYRLFSSDAEVTVVGGSAHVRDLSAERDEVTGGRPIFPIDNYAPIGVQEALIQYWYARGRPAAIVAPPAGTVRIGAQASPAGSVSPGAADVDELALDGVVWGTETAWFDRRAGQLIALTTWAGALPFEAIREGVDQSVRTFIDAAAKARVADLERLTAATRPQRVGTFTLTGATVVDGTGRPPMVQASVVIQGGRIAAVGPAAEVTPPEDFPVIDLRGATILPGLWDMHAHASQVDWALAYLAGGVTTIRDMGGEPDFLTRFRDATGSERALGPRILLAGLVDGSGPRAFGAVTADTPDEGRAVVRRYRDEHFDQIKIYDGVTPDVVAAMTAEAHALGMTVTGHVPRGMTAQSAVEAGFDQLAHMRITGQPGSDAVAAQIAFFKAHGTVMDPTESWNELGGHAAATPIESFQPGVARLPLTLRRTFASMTASAGDPAAIRARLLQSLQLVHEAQQAGLAVVAGTDKGVPGFSVQREIELYVAGGMTPMEAIQAATIVPARVMKLDAESGTVEAGKRADLVILAANPLDAISNIRTARWVVVNGRLYDCAALWKAAGYQ